METTRLCTIFGETIEALSTSRVLSVFYRISVPVRTANAAEFLDALRYVVNFTRMTTGNNVKAFYSDYATSYMSDRVTDYLAHNKIQLEVVPPYVCTI